MPDAGGLVIASSIQMAEYMATLIEMIEGERPFLVHSDMPNPRRSKLSVILTSVASFQSG
jgi:hypothetical protein